MKSYLILCALVLLVTSVPAALTQTQSSKEKIEAQGSLKLGEAQTRTLAPDAIHVWNLALEVDQYIAVKILQKGIDVMVRIVNPRGVRRGEVNDPTEISGMEKAIWITDIAGVWKVEVIPHAANSGDYEINWITRRKATKRDWQTVEVDSLNNLAQNYFAQGKYAEAESLFRRILMIQEKAFGLEDSSVAASLNNIAGMLIQQGKYVEAEPLVRRALAILENALGQNHPDVARILDNIAEIVNAQGKYAEAELLVRRTLVIREKTFGPDHPEVAQSLNNLAGVCWMSGRYAESEPLLKRSLAILEKFLGPDNAYVATSLNNLAELYKDQGKYAEAEQLHRQSLAIRVKVLGLGHADVASSLNNLAGLYEDQNKYAEAELLYREALAIAEKSLGPDHPDVAATLHNLAGIYKFQRKFADSESLYKQSLAIWEKVFGPNHPNVAMSLNNLTEIYYKEGKYAETEPLYHRSLTIFEKSLGPDHPNVAKNLDNLARLYDAQGKYAEAEPLHQRSLSIVEKALGPDHPEVAISLNKLAQSRFLQEGEKLETALPLLERSIAILNATAGFPKRRVEAYSLRAQVRKQNRDLEGALFDLSEALRSAEKLRSQIGGGEEIRAGFFEEYIDHFNRMVAWQLEAGQIEKALNYAERGRARVLLDQLTAGKIDLRSSIPTDIRTPLEKRETDAKARLAEYQQRINLMRSRKDLSEEEKMRQIAALQDSLKVADRDFQQAYEEIKNASPLWRDLITSGGQPVTLATIQHELVPKNGLMLLYQIGKDSSFLFIIPPAGQQPEAMSLQIAEKYASALNVKAGPLKSTDLQKIIAGQDSSGSSSGVIQFLSTYSQLGKAMQATQAKLFGAKLHALWQVLVPERLWPRLQQCAEVILIPDGALHLLPFETLVVKTGTNEKDTRYWLDEGPVIRYAQSATTLYNIEKRPAARIIPLANQPTVLSLSDPIYDPAEVAVLLQKQADKRLTSQDTSAVSVASTVEELMRGLTRDSYVRFGGNLARLPGTARETAAIRKAFGARGEVLELQQLAANEPKLRTGLSGKRYIHLATHGLVDERRQIIFSAFALTPPPTEKTVAEDDGFLQLFEIYDLKMPECELAVLSACRTNVGREYEGEGVFALSRGFLTAGARRVIASQWSVDDVSTAELMGAFFQKIAAAEKAGQQIDYALALRDAKRRVRNEKQWAAPYYWAPFVLTGKR